MVLPPFLRAARAQNEFALEQKWHPQRFYRSPKSDPVTKRCRCHFTGDEGGQIFN